MVAADDKSSKSPQIVSQDDSGGDPERPASPEASTAGVVALASEYRDDPTGECFFPLRLGPTLMRFSVASVLEEDRASTGEEGADSLTETLKSVFDATVPFAFC